MVVICIQCQHMLFSLLQCFSIITTSRGTTLTLRISQPAWELNSTYLEVGKIEKHWSMILFNCNIRTFAYIKCKSWMLVFLLLSKPECQLFCRGVPQTLQLPNRCRPILLEFTVQNPRFKNMCLLKLDPFSYNGKETKVSKKSMMMLTSRMWRQKSSSFFKF